MNRFKQLRVETGKSQTQVAEWLSISQAAYSKYECGKAEPSLEALIVLSDKYRVSIDYLLGRIDERSSQDRFPVSFEEFDKDTNWTEFDSENINKNIVNEILKSLPLSDIANLPEEKRKFLIASIKDLVKNLK